MAGRPAVGKARARGNIGTLRSGALGGAVPAMLRIEVGPVTWVCDATAYTSMLRAWRQAARLLGENPTEDE